MKKMICLLLAVTLTAVLLTGCGKREKSAVQTGKDGRIALSVYMWDRSMFKQLTPWLEQKFPDIDFTFVQSYNTIEYYKDMLDRGEDLPDIITCRRFSLNDAVPLSDYLMDLSKTEVAGTFYSSYLESNRETGGAIRWLPMCAEVDSLMANKDLFDRYGIALPTNYAEFIAVIDAFEALGIKGFQTDWTYDYTCLETLQGCAIPELMSLEGTRWRIAYESETEDNPVGLDDQVWPKVFAKYERFLRDVRFEPGDEKLNYSPVYLPYIEGKTAMIRATADMAESIMNEEDITSVILPYFGETAEDNWVLTYPMCQLAVARHVEEDKEKKDAVMRVLLAIFSEEGQRAASAGSSVLSYNKEVSISPAPSLKYVEDCIDSNHLYIRLASTEIFAISRDVAQKMMKGVYGAQGAYEDFSAQMMNYTNPEAEEILFTQETAYPVGFGEHGTPAGSSLMNTLRAANGEQIAIGYSSIISSAIYSGAYTTQQIKWIMTYKNNVYHASYTGEEIRRIMDWLVNVKADGSNPVLHLNLLPITSGMEYTVTETERGRFALGEITIDGKPLEEDAVYSVLLVGADTCLEHPSFCNCPMPQDLKDKREDQYVDHYSNHDCIREALAKTKQLLEPTQYVTILEKK